MNHYQWIRISDGVLSFGGYWTFNRLAEKSKLLRIDPIKSIDLHKIPRMKKKGNRLQLLSLNSKGFLFLNRGSHTIEQWSIQIWLPTRPWRNADLPLSGRDEIKLITCSRNGEHLAMNIRLNQQSWVIDFRRIDVHLTLIKRVQSSQGSICSHKLDISSQENSPITQWSIITIVMSLNGKLHRPSLTTMAGRNWYGLNAFQLNSLTVVRGFISAGLITGILYWSVHL